MGKASTGAPQRSAPRGVLGRQRPTGCHGWSQSQRPNPWSPTLPSPSHAAPQLPPSPHTPPSPAPDFFPSSPPSAAEPLLGKALTGSLGLKQPPQKQRGRLPPTCPQVPPVAPRQPSRGSPPTPQGPACPPPDEGPAPGCSSSAGKGGAPQRASGACLPAPLQALPL